MKFFTYWFICLILCSVAVLERMIDEIHGDEYSIIFWVLIGAAGFFWLCSYGEIRESKSKA